ncbi:HNH endonuclease [Escherichia phage ph0011]|nr:HNH endonuclease [Escherichia phage ph0011]
MCTIDELIRRNSKYYKPSEIVGNITKSEFGPNTRKLIHVMLRDGFKCDCCGESNVVFTLHKHSTKERYKFRPYVLKGKRLVRMTLDHNVLDCLQGGNDKENMTALCEDCNALRQHKFAEYSEFKFWYHNADRSIEPDVNYCFIEYIKNAKDTYILKSMSPITVFPENLFTTLKNSFMVGDIDAFKYFDKGAKHFEVQCLSTALCELIKIYIKDYLGIDNVRVPEYTFSIDFDCESIKEFGILFNKQIELAIQNEIKYYNTNI